MNWEMKVWGRVAHVFANEHAAVSCLDVRAGYQCSIHLHAQRVNQFSVLSGQLYIDIFPTDDTKQSVLVSQGETFVVDAGVKHRFRVVKTGMVVEVYWPAKQGDKVSIEDIIRDNVGGRV